MKKLRLPLKKQWFEMTRVGIKTEDYREITPYWCTRLLLVSGEKKSQKWWKEEFIRMKEEDLTLQKMLDFGLCSFIPFDQNEMTLGYPKSTDTKRIINLEHKGIEIGYGKAELGAEPNKEYFIIKHGDIL